MGGTAPWPSKFKVCHVSLITVTTEPSIAVSSGPRTAFHCRISSVGQIGKRTVAWDPKFGISFIYYFTAPFLVSIRLKEQNSGIPCIRSLKYNIEKSEDKPEAQIQSRLELPISRKQRVSSTTVLQILST